jgi:hypothetical protein
MGIGGNTVGRQGYRSRAWGWGWGWAVLLKNHTNTQKQTPLCKFAGVEYIVTYLAENVGLQPARARWCSRRCDAIAHATHAENVREETETETEKERGGGTASPRGVDAFQYVRGEHICKGLITRLLRTYVYFSVAYTAYTADGCYFGLRELKVPRKSQNSTPTCNEQTAPEDHELYCTVIVL